MKRFFPGLQGVEVVLAILQCFAVHTGKSQHIGSPRKLGNTSTNVVFWGPWTKLKNSGEKGQEVFFTTDQDPADILGMTDFMLVFFWILDFQIP